MQKRLVPLGTCMVQVSTGRVQCALLWQHCRALAQATGWALTKDRREARHGRGSGGATGASAAEQEWGPGVRHGASGAAPAPHELLRGEKLGRCAGRALQL
jgi:hypothetical protein